ncbi:MAG: hypothetical protein HS114_25420 [Anaerolineales bacterium]|nr:hypothetical protein [Anaerolineales bacterium]
MILLFLLPITSYAQVGGSYDLSWSTLDGGGGNSSGGNYILSGTIGQPDVGSMSGGNYVLAGGFWGGEGPERTSGNNNVYLPVIWRE